MPVQPWNSTLLQNLISPPKMQDPIERMTNAQHLKSLIQQNREASKRSQTLEEAKTIMREEGGVTPNAVKRMWQLDPLLGESLQQTLDKQQQQQSQSALQQSQSTETNRHNVATENAATAAAVPSAEREFQAAYPAWLEANQLPRNATSEMRARQDMKGIDPQTGLTYQQRNQSALEYEKLEQKTPANPTAAVQEYNFYAEQETKAGRQPLTFDRWQTQDANRKKPATPGSEPLVPTTDDLGNTTYTPRSQAAGMKVPISGNNKPPTAAEKKALGFYRRVDNALDQIDQMEGEVSQMGLGGQTRLTYAPNFLQSPVGKRFTQAKNDFINATLRRESGAAISDGEYKRFDQIYFPQPGDDAPTLAQKKKARDVQLDSLITDAGRAYTAEFGDTPKAGGTVVMIDGEGKEWNVPLANVAIFESNGFKKK